MKKFALISVTDKEGIDELAHAFLKVGCEIASTGGTAEHLKKCGIEVVEVADITGFPEGMDGRVKTLHPKVFGGILADLRKPHHVQYLTDQQIDRFDFVVVSLYDFKGAVASGLTFDETMEKIDIGGPSLLRAAGKNYKRPVVIPSKEFYRNVIKQLGEDGEVDEYLRRQMIIHTFEMTTAYDRMIVAYLHKQWAS